MTTTSVRGDGLSIETPLVTGNKNKETCTSKSKKICIFSLILIVILVSAAIVLWILLDTDDKKSVVFDPTTATISDILSEITSNVSCVSITKLYLNRISVYDKANNINSILLLNPYIINEANELDNFYRNNNQTLYGKLHCVPFLVKDNIDIIDIPTSGGIPFFNNNSMKSISNAAVIVSLIQNEGAILIGKTNLQTLSYSGKRSRNMIMPECHNPYSNQNRTCYGSSGGSGAGIASAFGVIGIGTDTQGSITLPASGANIFGVRPPTTMVSMNGIQPIFRGTDTVGPMTRSLIDSAIVMDILLNTKHFSTAHVLNKSKTIKFGHISNLWKQTIDIEDTYQFNVTDEIFSMQNDILNTLNTTNITLSQSEMHLFVSNFNTIRECWDACESNSWDEYLMFHGNYTNVNEIINSNVSNSSIPDWFIDKLISSVPLNCTSKCVNFSAGRNSMQEFFNNIFDSFGIDVMVFPGTPIPPSKVVDLDNPAYRTSVGFTSFWYTFVDYPAISVPIGFTSSIADDSPLGLPQAMILISKPEDFDKLFTAAYTYEQSFQHRQLPQAVPLIN